MNESPQKNLKILPLKLYVFIEASSFETTHFNLNPSSSGNVQCNVVSHFGFTSYVFWLEEEDDHSRLRPLTLSGGIRRPSPSAKKAAFTANHLKGHTRLSIALL